MLYKRFVCAALAGASLFLAGDGPAVAHQTPQSVLTQIERGQWLLKEQRGGGERKICFTAPVTFIQLEHGQQPCEQFVIAQDNRAATIRYTCSGHGVGRTTVTVETPRLVRIQTQGVLDGSPFELEYEARKVGTCA